MFPCFFRLATLPRVGIQKSGLLLGKNRWLESAGKDECRCDGVTSEFSLSYLHICVNDVKADLAMYFGFLLFLRSTHSRRPCNRVLFTSSSSIPSYMLRRINLTTWRDILTTIWGPRNGIGEGHRGEPKPPESEHSHHHSCCLDIEI
jgi:hypothetical protein